MAFEVLEHTADIALHVTSMTLEELFADAGRGLASLIVENPEAIELRKAIVIELEAEDIEGLFVDWLRELIYRFETEHQLYREFSIDVGDGNRRLRAECRGEAVDWTRHQPDNEVKAVTYHQLRVSRTATGWDAHVIFDI
jgi:SHS2 domain-containing protein